MIKFVIKYGFVASLGALAYATAVGDVTKQDYMDAGNMAMDGAEMAMDGAEMTASGVSSAWSWSVDTYNHLFGENS